MHNGRMLTAVYMPVYTVHKRGREYNVLSARMSCAWELGHNMKIRIEIMDINGERGLLAWRKEKPSLHNYISASSHAFFISN